MNNTTLEKMQWLADKGFEPDMVDVGAGMLCPYDPEEKMDKDLDAPYFTESRLWSLLPDVINPYTGNYRLMIEDTHVMYCSIERGSLDQKILSWTLKGVRIEDNDLHTALLDLTIWAVKEGHLKAEKSV